MSDNDSEDTGGETEVAQVPAPSRRSRRLLVAAVACLVAMVLFSAWWARSALRQREALATIQSSGGKVKYADQLPFASLSTPARWLMQWLGHDWAASIVQVNLSGASLKETDCQALGELSGLRFLWMNGSSIDDQSMAHLRRLTRLEELYLSNTSVTDEGVQDLAGLKHLRFLSLAGTKVSDKGLSHLGGLTNLTRLDLPGTNVTAAGVNELQKVLRGTKIVYTAEGHGIHASSTGSDGKPRDDAVGARH